MKLDNKNKLLLGVFFLMLLLSYHLAFKKTLKLKEEYSANVDKQELAIHVPEELLTLSRKERYLDSQFLDLNLGTSSMQNDLLKFLNEVSTTNKVKIIEFKSPHVFHEGNSVSKTYVFNLEGNFIDMLKVVYALEKKGSFGAISHIGFEKKKNYRSRKRYLQTLVFLEHAE